MKRMYVECLNCNAEFELVNCQLSEPSEQGTSDSELREACEAALDYISDTFDSEEYKPVELIKQLREAVDKADRRS